MGNFLEKERTLTLPEAPMAMYRRPRRRSFAALQEGAMASQAAVPSSTEAALPPGPAGAPAGAKTLGASQVAMPSSLAPQAHELCAILWGHVKLETLWENYQAGLEAALLQEISKLSDVSTWETLRTQMQAVTKAGDALQAARTEKQNFENGLEGNALEIVKNLPETVEYVKEWIAAVREQDYEPRQKLSQAFKRLLAKAHETKSISGVKAEPKAKAALKRR
jgi:hypothetical protein